MVQSSKPSVLQQFLRIARVLPFITSSCSPSSSSSWTIYRRMRGKNVLSLERGLLALIFIIITLESRRRLRSWRALGSCLIGLWGVQRVQGWFFRRYHRSSSQSLLATPFLRDHDESSALAGTTTTSSSAGGGPFVRHVLLGDRGRARCSCALRQQFLTHAYCDVIFVVEGRTFPAHRCWVSTFSMPISAMFNSGMRESQQSSVVLKDTNADAFDLMLDYIYGGPVELNQDNIECVLELSVRFAVGALVEQCCNFLASAVSDDTAWSILILADPLLLSFSLSDILIQIQIPNSSQRYNCRPLRRDILLFVVAHLPRWLAVSPEYFARLPRSLLIEILGDDAMIHGESVAFHAAIFWLQERKKSLPGGLDDALIEEIMAQIRFPYMPARLLVEEVEGHPLMQTEMCKRYILEAYRYQAVLQRSNTDQEILHKHEEAMGVRARPRRKRQQHQQQGSTHQTTTSPTLLLENGDCSSPHDEYNERHYHFEGGGAIVPIAIASSTTTICKKSPLHGKESSSSLSLLVKSAAQASQSPLPKEAEMFFRSSSSGGSGNGGEKEEATYNSKKAICAYTADSAAIAIQVNNRRMTCDV